MIGDRRLFIKNSSLQWPMNNYKTPTAHASLERKRSPLTHGQKSFLTKLIDANLPITQCASICIQLGRHTRKPIQQFYANRIHPLFL